MAKIDVSIIVCAYNEENTLYSCLSSLDTQLKDVPSVEVLVIDNESTDKTGAIAKKFIKDSSLKIKYLRMSHLPLTSSRNTGIHYSKGEIVIFIDADAVADSHWYSNILIGFTDKSVAIVSGKISLLNRECRFSNFAYRAFFRAFLDTGGSKLIGANMALRRSVFRVTGGFFSCIKSRGDETSVAASYFEKKPTDKEYYEDRAIVYHELEETLFSWFKNRYIEGKSGADISSLFKSSIRANIVNVLRWLNVLFVIHILLGLFFSWSALFVFHLCLVSLRYIPRSKSYLMGIRNVFNYNLFLIPFVVPFCVLTVLALDFGYIGGFLFSRKKVLNLENSPVGQLKEIINYD